MSLEYEEPGKGWSVEAETLHLQFGQDADGNRLGVSVGLVKAPKRVREAKGVRIVKEHGRYFAVFTLEERPVRKTPGRATRHGNGRDGRALLRLHRPEQQEPGVWRGHGRGRVRDRQPAGSA